MRLVSHLQTLSSRLDSCGAGAQACDCKRNRLWVRFPLDEMKHLFKFIFSFLRSGVEAKRGIEFRHSTRNAPRIRRKMVNEVS